MQSNVDTKGHTFEGASLCYFLSQKNSAMGGDWILEGCFVYMFHHKKITILKIKKKKSMTAKGYCRNAMIKSKDSPGKSKD